MNNLREHMLDFKGESLGNNLVRDIQQCDGPPIAYVFKITNFRYEFDSIVINNAS